MTRLLWMVFQIAVIGFGMWAIIDGALKDKGRFPLPGELLVGALLSLGMASIATGLVYWTMELWRRLGLALKIFPIAIFALWMWFVISLLGSDELFQRPGVLLGQVLMGLVFASIATGIVYWTIELLRRLVRRATGLKDARQDQRAVIPAAGKFLEPGDTLRPRPKQIR